MDPGDPVRLLLEFQVPSLGRAKASHTDLMVVSPRVVVAIEGKSTEPAYPTVTDWLAQGGPNREAVLGHWLLLHGWPGYRARDLLGVDPVELLRD